MKRAAFLLGLASAALVVTSFRSAGSRRAASRRCPSAGRCADSRRKLRWSGYTAADFT
jgi:hypothetical protein